MGSHNAISELRDSQNGASDHESPASELRFNGFNAGNHEVSGPETVTDLKSRDFAGKFDSGVGSNLARYKSMSPASLPIVRSPCLTIPPGLSPTALLDSPVLLSNMHAEPSPTTGTFSLPLSRHDGGLDPFPSPRDASNNRSYQDGSPDSFVFKPHVGSCSTSGLPSVGSLASHSYNYQQYSHLAQAQGQYQAKSLASLPSVKNEQATASAHELYLSVKVPDPPPLLVTSRALVPAEVATDEQRQRHGSHSDAQALQFDYKGPGPLMVIERPSEDGYNWRKYGQKQVKGSEYPRSYYKCTHPNCQMKKQLERSHDGQITEIIYKGTHDHPKPQPSRRLAVGAVIGSQEEERLEGFCSLNNTDDKLSNGHGLASNHMDSNGNIELSCVSASDDDGEGLAVQPNNMDIEVEEDDPESKRRKQEFGVVDATPISRAPREPRVVVQTVSEVDILDDGYRWRKYGQKVVKGNPNPRSYYKCTNAGCPVRKHVERASHDPKAVITTYEGKHNHDVPTARINSHETAGSLITPNINIIKDPRSISYYESPDQKDAISLDLGVGIGQSLENGSMEKQQIPDSGQVSQIPGSSCNNLLEVTPISSFYGGLYGNRDGFGSREDQGEGFSFKSMALNHSSNKYHQNMGSLLMGP